MAGQWSRTFAWRINRKDDQGFWVEAAIPGEPNWKMAGLFVEVGGRIVLAELRLLPNRGKTTQRVGAQPVTVTAGSTEWRIGPVEIDRGAGEWSRKANDLGEDAKGVTARLLRQLPIGAFVKEVLGLLQPERMPPGWRKALTEKPRRPGRVGHDDAYYLPWAVEYDKRSRSKSPIADIAAAHGRKPEQVRDLIFRARRRGLLTDTEPGRAEGKLTAKARRLLEETKGKGSER
jgi:hypothetical protein